MLIAAAQSRKPVKKPKRMFSQLAWNSWDAAKMAPTKTAKPIIAQLIGRINRMNPQSLPMLLKPFVTHSWLRLVIKILPEKPVNV